MIRKASLWPAGWQLATTYPKLQLPVNKIINRPTFVKVNDLWIVFLVSKINSLKKAL